VGLVAAVVAVGWLATRPSLSPQARMLRSSQAGTAEPAAATGSPWAEPAGEPQTPLVEKPSESVPVGRQQEPEPEDSDVLAQLIPQAAAVRTEEPAPPPSRLRDLTVYERTEKIETTRFHIVRKDETLSAISQQYYGTANKWRKILEANADTIKDANKISPGAKLTIPD